MKYVSYSHYFTWRHWALIYTILAIVSFAPLIAVILAAVFGQEFGCGNVTEGLTVECPGRSIIQFFFSLGWLGLITFPFGIFLGILLAIANLLWYFTRKSGQDRL